MRHIFLTGLIFFSNLALAGQPSKADNQTKPALTPAEIAAQKLYKAGPEHKESIEALTLGIYKEVIEKSDGDEEALHRLMLDAQTNPEKFLKSLTPQQQAEVRRLAAELEKKK